MKEKIQARWEQLDAREKKTVLIGSIFATLLLFYTLIWSPLTNKVVSLRHEIRSDQQLLAWMKQNDQRLQTLEQTPPLHAAPAANSLFSDIQNQLNTTDFAKQTTKLQQTDSDSVQLGFLAVNFDAFITWLTQLWQQDGIIVSQATMTSNNTPGMVATDIVLQRSVH